MEHSAGAVTADLRALYQARRERVLNKLGGDAALVLAATPELVVGRDTELRYVVDPELYYLTGYTEPDAVAVFVPAHTAAPFTLFVRPRAPDREVWTGPRGGGEAATAVFGAQEAYPLEELERKLPALLATVDTIYGRLDRSQVELSELLQRALEQGRRARPRQGRGPHSLTDPGRLLDELRLVNLELRAGRGNGLHQVGAAYQTDQLAVADDGNAFDAVRLHHHRHVL